MERTVKCTVRTTAGPRTEDVMNLSQKGILYGRECWEPMNFLLPRRNHQKQERLPCSMHLQKANMFQYLSAHGPARPGPTNHHNANSKKIRLQQPSSIPITAMTDVPRTTTANQYSLAGKHVNVAMLTAGGLAPCLSSSIALLLKYWVEAKKDNQISGLTFRMYRGGYKGLLTGDSFVVPESEWDACATVLNDLGGSPIGNSRVKVRLCRAPGLSRCNNQPLLLY